MVVFIPKGTGNVNEMQNWLREQKISHDPVSRILENQQNDHRLTFTGHQFVFHNAADAIAFKLRWL